MTLSVRDDCLTDPSGRVGGPRCDLEAPDDDNDVLVPFAVLLGDWLDISNFIIIYTSADWHPKKISNLTCLLL